VSALAIDQTDRRSRQSEVEALLMELDKRRRKLYRLKAHGVRRAGLRDLKQELIEIGQHLREVVAPPA
jgi:hypothetical protein